MTVYGLDYRPKPYEPTSATARLLPLAASEFRALFRSRWGIVLFVFCSFPTLGRLFMLLAWLGVLAFGGGPARHLADNVAENAPSELRDFVPTNVGFYMEPVVGMEQGAFLVLLLLTAMSTARAIAKDRATNALELYWTRGISPFGYFGAKWSGSFALVGTLTIGGPLLLWLTGVLLADDWSFLRETVGFMPLVLLGLTVFTAVLTGLCILVSAIAGSANVATIVWCLLLGGSAAVAQVLRQVLRRDDAAMLNVWEATATLARGCVGTVRRDGNVGVASAVVFGLAFALLLAARRRLRISEAIG